MRLRRRTRRASPAAVAYARARLPARSTPWREAAFCVVDLETTGLDPRRDAIVAWSAVPVDGGRVVLGGAREGLARPAAAVPPASIRIHGLRDLDLAGAPSQAEAVDALLEAMAGRVLVAHAAWVERAFLGRALHGRGDPAAGRGGGHDGARARCGCVSAGATRRRGSRSGPWRPSSGLPVHGPHRATGDALTTAQAFIALAAHLERGGGGETIRSLAAAQDRLDAGRLYARYR